MKRFLNKPLGLAISAALLAGGMTLAPTASATTDSSQLGDLAIVPYYTVLGDYMTGVSIINTTNSVQVVKVRLRRATDSADVIDFNLVMSPEDVWAGSINFKSGKLGIDTRDTTCTVPKGTDQGGGKVRFIAQDINATGAEEGYIEIIGMGQANGGAYPYPGANPFPSSTAAEGLVAAATHVSGTGAPANCDIVRANFRRGGVVNMPILGATVAPVLTGNENEQTLAARLVLNGGGPLAGDFSGVTVTNGVVDTDTTAYAYTVLGQRNVAITQYSDTPSDALKVSFFQRNTKTGTEFGGNAVHIKDFRNQRYVELPAPGGIWDPDNLVTPFPNIGDDRMLIGGVPMPLPVTNAPLVRAMISNQSGALVNGDPTGSAYPDLDGGPIYSFANNVHGLAVANGGGLLPADVTPLSTLLTEPAPTIAAPLGGGLAYTGVRGESRGRYDAVIRNGAGIGIGVNQIMNEWSFNPTNGVSTDWVVTVPGQYLMIDPDPIFGQTKEDFRDLPMRAAFAVWDREEKMRDGAALVVSPGSAGNTTLANEVNVIEWGGRSVFNSADANVHEINPHFGDSSFGWATLSLASNNDPRTDEIATLGIDEGCDQLIFDQAVPARGDANTIRVVGNSSGCAAAAGKGYLPTSMNLADGGTDQIPVVAFTAWLREFGDASRNYGHLVYHSYK